MHRVSKISTSICQIVTVGLLLVAFTGCGTPVTIKQGNAPAPLSGNQPIMQVGQLFLNSPEYAGGSDTLTFNGKDYLIGGKTLQQPTQLIQQLHSTYPNGRVTLSVQFTGNIEQESGRFPNPMVAFDVIQIQTLQKY